MVSEHSIGSSVLQFYSFEINTGITGRKLHLYGEEAAISILVPRKPEDYPYGIHGTIIGGIYIPSTHGNPVRHSVSKMSTNTTS